MALCAVSQVGTVASSVQKPELEATEKRCSCRTAAQLFQTFGEQRVQVVDGLSFRCELIDQLGQIAAVGEFDGIRELRWRTQEIAAVHENQAGPGAHAEVDAHAGKRVQAVGEPAPRVLCSLGDPGEFARVVGEERDNLVRLAVGAAPQDDGSTAL